jgi:hypothetical protein
MKRNSIIGEGWVKISKIWARERRIYTLFCVVRTKMECLKSVLEAVDLK